MAAPQSGSAAVRLLAALRRRSGVAASGGAFGEAALDLGSPLLADEWAAWPLALPPAARGLIPLMSLPHFLRGFSRLWSPTRAQVRN